MVNRTFDFMTCSVYRFTSVIHKGSQIQNKTLVYSNIECSFWGKKSKTSGQLEVNTNTLQYEVNIVGNYEIKENDIIILENVEYRVTDIMPHPDRWGEIDNIQIFVTKNKNG